VETCLARAYLHGSDVDIIHEKMRTGEIRDNYADISKAKKILGYVPKISLGPGLRSLVEDD
jgi:UDP-glucose 4-epimerase